MSGTRSDLPSVSQIHLLQSPEWGKLKEAFGWKPVLIQSDSCRAQILFRKPIPGICMGYIPKGPQGVWDEAFASLLEAEARKHKAFMIHVEPDHSAGQMVDAAQLSSKGKIVTDGIQSVQPRSTIVIDLEKSEDELLAAMKQKTRYNIRLAQKKGVQIVPSTDVKQFAELMKTTGARDEFGVHTTEYYQRSHDLFQAGGHCQLFFATFGQEVLGGIMAFAYSDRAYYLYGASSNDNRNLMPNYLLQWEVMRWAKDKGCSIYDLWGIPDESSEVLERDFLIRQDGLWKVYRFKRGFGGQIERSGSPFDIVYNSLFYKAFRKFANR